MLTEYGKKIQIYVVTQFNHPNELTSEAREAVHTLMRAGIVVKNQTVLLKGVNDRPEVLGKLLQETTAMGIISLLRIPVQAGNRRTQPVPGTSP